MVSILGKLMVRFQSSYADAIRQSQGELVYLIDQVGERAPCSDHSVDDVGLGGWEGLELGVERVLVLKVESGLLVEDLVEVALSLRVLHVVVEEPELEVSPVVVLEAVGEVKPLVSPETLGPLGVALEDLTEHLKVAHGSIGIEGLCIYVEEFVAFVDGGRVLDKLLVEARIAIGRPQDVGVRHELQREREDW